MSKPTKMSLINKIVRLGKTTEETAVVIFDFSLKDKTVKGYTINRKLRPFSYNMATGKLKKGKPIRLALGFGFVSSE